MGESRGLISPERIIKDLDEKCILCMSLGMSYKDYWEGDNRAPIFLIKAYNERRRREMEDNNFKAWLNGMYNMRGYAVVLANAFSEKGSDPAEYPDKPFALFGSEKSQQDEQQERERAEIAVEIALDNFVAALGGKRKGTKASGRSND